MSDALDEHFMQQDEHFMQLALAQAELALSVGEVPVGAILVLHGQVIAQDHNRVEQNVDPTAHAELAVIKRASRALGNWRLTGAALYCTLEPCAMCLGAVINSRCAEVIWAAPDLRQGAAGSWCNLLQARHPIHQPKARSGCLQEKSGALLRGFFRSRRGKL